MANVSLGAMLKQMAGLPAYKRDPSKILCLRACAQCRAEFPVTKKFPDAKYCGPKCQGLGLRATVRAAALEAVTKLCKTCRTSKPLAQFYRHKNGRFGWREVCIACFTAALRAWKEAHPERRKQHNANYYRAAKAKNPLMMRTRRSQRRARERQAGGTFTAEQLTTLYGRQRGKCVGCRQALGGKFHADHVIALAAGGSNGISNIQLLCETCNRSKGVKHPIAFMQQRGFLL